MIQSAVTIIKPQTLKNDAGFKFTVKSVCAAIPAIANAPTSATVARSTSRTVVSVESRFNAALQMFSTAEQKKLVADLQFALKEFKKHYPITNWDKLDLPIAAKALMSEIFIDITLQRQIDLKWVIKIIKTFVATRCAVIGVYRDNDYKGKLISWDSQHTIMALWLIARHLGLDPSTLTVPVGISKCTSRTEMRINLMAANSQEGRHDFTPFDEWQQFVYGVREDGCISNPVWVATEVKNTYLEKNNLFVVRNGAGNEKSLGAISNVQALMKFDAPVVNHLAEYLAKSTNGTRPADALEIQIIGDYFDCCVKTKGLVIDKSYISSMHLMCHSLFNCEMSGTENKFWRKVRAAYKHWYNEHGNETNNSSCSKKSFNAIPFLVAQIKKSTKLRTPTIPAKLNGFTPTKAFLF